MSKSDKTFAGVVAMGIVFILLAAVILVGAVVLVLALMQGATV